MDINHKFNKDLTDVASRIIDTLQNEKLHGFVFAAVTRDPETSTYYEVHECSDPLQVPVLLDLSEEQWLLMPKLQEDE